MRKNTFVLILSLIIMIVPQINASADRETQQVKMLFDHSFSMCRERADGYGGRMSAWDINDAGGRILNAGYMQMIDTSDIFPVEATRHFEEISAGTATLEFSFTVSDSMENGGFELRSGDESILSLIMHKGALAANGKVIDYITPNKWQYVRIETDFSNASAIIYINGSKKADIAMHGTSADNFYITSGDAAMGNMSTSYARMYTGYNVYENFDNGGFVPKDWIVLKDKKEVSGSFKNTLNSANCVFQLQKDFDKLNTPTVMEFDAIQPQSRNFYFRVYDGTTVAFMLTADGENFYYKSGKTTVPVYSGYKENMWYSFRIILYPDTKTADIYINGRIAKSGAEFYKNTASGFDKLDFYLDKNADAPNVTIDNVRVYPYETFSDYVPEPNKVVSNKYSVGMQFCPLWTEGENFGYDWLRDSTVRESVLGFYDENSPETMDWAIKYMVEHGMDFQWHCIYMHGKNNEPFEPSRGSPLLHEAYFKAKYADMMDFAILWENEVSGGWSEDTAENRENFLKYMVPFWIEYYFKNPSYKMIDGRPMVGIYHLTALRKTFGSAAEISDMFLKMGDLREAEGLGRPYLVLNTYLVDFAESAYNAYKQYGFEASYAYNMGSNNAKKQLAYHKKGAAAANSVSDYRYIPTVSQGFDSLLANGTVGYKMTAEEFDGYLAHINSDIMPGIKADTSGKKLIIAATWNEYSEGHYFMPTNTGGFGYLDSFRKNLCGNEKLLDVDCTESLQFAGWNIWNGGNASYSSAEKANLTNSSWSALTTVIPNYGEADKVRITLKKENGAGGLADFAITRLACKQCSNIADEGNTYYRQKMQVNAGDGYTVAEIPITHTEGEENEARIWVEAGNYIKRVEVLPKGWGEEHTDIIPTVNQKDRFNNLYPSDRTTPVIEKNISEQIPENASVKYSWTFEHNTAGWEAVLGCTVGTENGRLRVVPSENTAVFMCDGIGKDISDVSYVRIKFADSVSFDEIMLEYTTNFNQSFSGKQRLRRMADGTSEAVFPVGMYPMYWQGILGALKITANGASSAFDIAAAELLSVPCSDSILKINGMQINMNDDFSGDMIPLRRIAYYSGSRIYTANGEITAMRKNGDVIKLTPDGYSVNGAEFEKTGSFAVQNGEAYADTEAASVLLGCNVSKDGNVVTVSENQNARIVYGVDFAENKGYFTSICNIRSAELKDGAYELSYAAGDPFISTDNLRNENIKCGDIGKISIGMESDTDFGGQLFYVSDANGNYNETMSVRFGVSSGMHEYEIMPAGTGMDGILKGLRLDLGDKIENTVRIKYIKIYTKQQLRTYIDNTSPANGNKNISANTKSVTAAFLQNPQSIGKAEISGGAEITNISIDGTKAVIGLNGLEPGRKYRIHLNNINMGDFTAEEYFDFTTKISPNEVYAMEFDETYNGAFFSWGGGYDSIETTGSCWNILSGGENPYLILNSVSIPADKVKYINVKVKSNKAIKGKIYFTTDSNSGYSESKAFTYDIPAGDFSVIKIPVDGNALWNGTVTGIRKDFITSGESTAISLDYIRMTSDDFSGGNWILGNTHEENGVYYIDALYNNSDIKRTVSAITADYADGKLVDAQCKTIEIAPHSSETVAVKKSERVFIWDGYSPIN